MSKIQTLLTDVGGVLLTNGWDHHMRRRASEEFGFDYEEMEKRHQLVFSTYELGKISLSSYLDLSLFYEERSFSKEAFSEYMLAQSQPYPEMLALYKETKERYGLKIAAVTNEGKELILHRIHKLGLTESIDFFFASGLVHLRKPDPEMFALALNAAQTAPDRTLYIDDREQLVQIAREMGMHGIHHVSYETTKRELHAMLRERSG